MNSLIHGSQCPHSGSASTFAVSVTFYDSIELIMVQNLWAKRYGGNFIVFEISMIKLVEFHS